MSEKIKEITLADLDTTRYIDAKVAEISEAVEDGKAINALSGGVDSSTVTMLGHRALGNRLKTVFVDNGLMREGEPQYVADTFSKLGVDVKVIDAHEVFFSALKDLTDPEEKRELGITRPFYQGVFLPIVRDSGATHLLHGTIYTDVEETEAGIKRQHNVDPFRFQKKGVQPYQILEPLIELRKPAVREVAKALGLPSEIYERMPFLGPALAGRIIGEVTPEKVETVRQATAIVERELADTGAFQYMAILHDDRVTGLRDGARDYGLQIEVRCWNTEDAVVAHPTEVPYQKLTHIADRLTKEVPGVVSVTYNVAKKPPSTMEAV